jgi:DNA-binding MarR family transcriptional regulator
MLAPFGITPQQYLLIRLARRRGASSPSMAASELGSDRPTMTLIARTCLEKGWLERKESAGDGRSYKLYLTGRGEELLDRIEASHALSPQGLGDPLDILDIEERTEFLRLLDKVGRRAADVMRI